MQTIGIWNLNMLALCLCLCMDDLKKPGEKLQDKTEKNNFSFLGALMLLLFCELTTFISLFSIKLLQPQPVSETVDEEDMGNNKAMFVVCVCVCVLWLLGKKISHEYVRCFHVPGSRSRSKNSKTRQTSLKTEWRTNGIYLLQQMDEMSFVFVLHTKEVFFSLFRTDASLGWNDLVDDVK